MWKAGTVLEFPVFYFVEKLDYSYNFLFQLM